jgi:hypothetical protein
MNKPNYNKLLKDISNFIKTIPECDNNLKGKGVVISEVYSGKASDLLKK